VVSGKFTLIEKGEILASIFIDVCASNLYCVALICHHQNVKIFQGLEKNFRFILYNCCFVRLFEGFYIFFKSFGDEIEILLSIKGLNLDTHLERINDQNMPISEEFKNTLILCIPANIWRTRFLQLNYYVGGKLSKKNCRWIK